jgi:hypothetical protein
MILASLDLLTEPELRSSFLWFFVTIWDYMGLRMEAFLRGVRGSQRVYKALRHVIVLIQTSGVFKLPTYNYCFLVLGSDLT